MDFSLFWPPFLNRFLQFCLLSLQGTNKILTNICQDLQSSNKINQDHPQDRQAQNCTRNLPERRTKTPSPKVEGAVVSRRMASSIASPLPLGTNILEFASSKASAGLARSAGPVPKISCKRVPGLKFRILSDFMQICFCLNNLLNFGSPQNASKSQILTLVLISVAFGTPFGINFLYISRLPEN